jgi:hypothetical protein
VDGDPVICGEVVRGEWLVRIETEVVTADLKGELARLAA